MKMTCGCIIDQVGVPPDSRECGIHKGTNSPCPETQCAQYRPAALPTPGYPAVWPKCVCGEIAQDHD